MLVLEYKHHDIFISFYSLVAYLEVLGVYPWVLELQSPIGNVCIVCYTAPTCQVFSDNLLVPAGAMSLDRLDVRAILT